MNKTKIEYCDESWNPVTGCTNDLPCREYCWARKMAPRLRGRCGYDVTDPFKLTFHPNRLDEPLRLGRKSSIAVCFMGDIGSNQIPNDWLIKVFGTMMACPQHTFLVLTKCPQRLAHWLCDPDVPGQIGLACDQLFVKCEHSGTTRKRGPVWPLGNVIVGTSFSNQQEADERVSQLLKYPGRKWLNIEPIQGPIQLNLGDNMADDEDSGVGCIPCDRAGVRHQHLLHQPCWRGIDWVVAGGGPLPVHPDWFRSIRDQCQAASVPFWFKQWGNFRPAESTEQYGPGRVCISPNGDCDEWHKGLVCYANETEGTVLRRVGKKAAGCLLDGREYKELPGGIDYDADADDKTPADMIAHVGGLIYKAAEAAVEKGAK